MNDYTNVLGRLQLLMGDNPTDDNIYRQASEAIEMLLAQQNGQSIKSRPLDEPSDHEAEGAMRYVMSRGA